MCGYGPFRFEDAAKSESAYGYQIDHILGAHDNSIQNGRLLCVPCHKRTPSYGSTSLAALLNPFTQWLPVPPPNCARPFALNPFAALAPTPKPPASASTQPNPYYALFIATLLNEKRV